MIINTSINPFTTITTILAAIDAINRSLVDHFLGLIDSISVLLA